MAVRADNGGRARPTCIMSSHDARPATAHALNGRKLCRNKSSPPRPSAYKWNLRRPLEVGDVAVTIILENSDEFPPRRISAACREGRCARVRTIPVDFRLIRCRLAYRRGQSPGRNVFSRTNYTLPSSIYEQCGGSRVVDVKRRSDREADY